MLAALLFTQVLGAASPSFFLLANFEDIVFVRHASILFKNTYLNKTVYAHMSSGHKERLLPRLDHLRPLQHHYSSVIFPLQRRRIQA